MSDIYKHDPLAAGEGAFKALITNLKFTAKRGGASFAVSGTWPWLSPVQALDSARVDSANPMPSAMGAIRRRMAQEKVEEVVFYPSATAAAQAKITAEVGLGGLAHEAGHYLCDRVNLPHSEAEIEKAFAPYLNALGKWAVAEGMTYVPLGGVGRWANILADIRLERLLAREYPLLAVRFRSVQEWIGGLEKIDPSNEDPKLLGACIRDLGKRWLTTAEVEAIYHPDIIAKAEQLRPLWDFSHFEGEEWDKSLAWPAVNALAMMLALLEGGEPPEPPKPPQPPKGRKPVEKGPEKGPDGGGGDDGEDDDDEGKEKGKGKGKGKEKGEEKGKGKGKGKGGDDEGDDGEGEGDDGEGDLNPDGGKEGGTDAKRWRDAARDPEALDPSSAMEKALKNAPKPDHAVSHRPPFGFKKESFATLRRRR